jgi:hypothetical protein
MGRGVLLATVAMAGAALSLNSSAGAQSLSASASVDLRLSQPGSIRGRARFHGYARFVPPPGWHVHRNAVDEVTIGDALSPTCSVHAYVSSTSSIGKQTPLRQLRAGLPRASQPGQPIPFPVRTVADGNATGGSGAWMLVEPSAQAKGSFTLYGAVLLKVRQAHWGGLTVGFVSPSGCSPKQLQEAKVTAKLEKLLRTTQLRDASFN